VSDWRSDLENLLHSQQEIPEIFPQEILRSQSSMVSTFLSENAIPAFEELRAEFTKYGREVSFFRDSNSISIEISGQDKPEFKYGIVIKIVMGKLSLEVVIRYPEGMSSIQKIYSQPFGDLDKENPLAGISKKDILNHFMLVYREYTMK
jgi:hypothetical protein